MENLPKNVLSKVAAYLESGTRVLLAVALTAPPSSWVEWDSTKILSRASKIVMSSPYYRMYERNDLYEETWDDFAKALYYVHIRVRKKLTDGDICGILVSINARSKLKTFSFPSCVKVQGHGLAPLRDSVFLEKIDLSFKDLHNSPVVEPKPTLSKDAVLPILQSIIGSVGNTPKLLILPKAWREHQTEALDQLIESYNENLNRRKLGCSNCYGICIRTSKKQWMSQESDDYGVQNFTCHTCAEWFCNGCEIERGIQFCPCCERQYCDNLDCWPLVKTCRDCNTTACGNCRSMVKCSICNQNSCEDCSGYYCDHCDKMICKNCCPLVKCTECESCHSSSCNDCVKNADGCVQLCNNCGGRFCAGCKPMEYCFHVGQYVCQKCQCKNHDIIDCYWQVLPPKLRELVPAIATGVTMDNILKFWKECIQLHGSDREFDHVTYQKAQQSEIASYIIAVDFLLKGKHREAVYMLHYGGGMMKEICEHGPDFIMNLIKKKINTHMPKEMLLCTYLDGFHAMIEETASQAGVVEYLCEEIHRFISPIKGAKHLSHMLSKVERSDCAIHLIDSVRGDEFQKEMCHTYGDSMKMEITISNMDHDFEDDDEEIVYKNYSLSWFLKIYVIKCNYHSWMRSPNITPSTKYFRILHQEKTMFLSSSGKKTLWELGIKDGDVITVGGVDLGESNKATSKQRSTKTSTERQSMKSGGSKKKKKLSKPHSSLHTLSLTEDELMEKYREEHSRSMSPVLGELKPVLKEIRNGLNNLTLHKTAPKARKAKSRKKIKPQATSLTTPLSNECLGGKAGKVAYPILVGEVANLYKTTKRSGVPTTTIDLHGLSKGEALEKLDKSLACWVDTALRGDYPWVIPVDIICGGGSQILSDAVRDWIRHTYQVANRPKGFT